ncbi:MAG: (d)CMP kinase [Solobacterium sp.]|nr:(d)CMP kinase [Solobacterium sp.]
MKINIAIDGPSAAGKSTVSKRIAEELNYVHLDTGAMYRCCAYTALKHGLSLEDEDAVCALLEKTKIEMTPDGKIYLDGEDVTLAIRDDDVSMAASDVSKLKRVREDLVKRQQEMAKDKGFVMDGRDIGTVVLKDAEVKIYLTASVEARAERRYKQNKEAGILENDLEQIKKDIAARDEQDMNREFSPLRKADDAIEVDSSDLTVDEVIAQIMQYVNQALEKKESHA